MLTGLGPRRRPRYTFPLWRRAGYTITHRTCRITGSVTRDRPSPIVVCSCDTVERAGRQTEGRRMRQQLEAFPTIERPKADPWFDERRRGRTWRSRRRFRLDFCSIDGGPGERTRNGANRPIRHRQAMEGDRHWRGSRWERTRNDRAHLPGPLQEVDGARNRSGGPGKVQRPIRPVAIPAFLFRMLEEWRRATVEERHAGSHQGLRSRRESLGATRA